EEAADVLGVAAVGGRLELAVELGEDPARVVVALAVDQRARHAEPDARVPPISMWLRCSSMRSSASRDASSVWRSRVRLASAIAPSTRPASPYICIMLRIGVGSVGS